MVKPVENLHIEPHALGSELDLSWVFPDELPENFHTILLKKPESDLTSEEISSYFALWNEIDQLKKQDTPDSAVIAEKTHTLNQALKNNSIFAARMYSAPTSYTDMLCVNGMEYFYQVFIQNTETYEISNAAGISGKPTISAKTTLIDSKTLVRRACDRIIKALNANIPEKKLQIVVQKEFAIQEGVDQWITVSRAAAEVEQRFFGNQLYTWNKYKASGFIEKEVIQVSWFSRNNPDFLDKLTMLFRANTEALTRFFYHQNGVIECLVSFMPDGADERDPDGKTLFSGMLVAVLSETSTIKEEFAAPVEFELNAKSECEEYGITE